MRSYKNQNCVTPSTQGCKLYHIGAHSSKYNLSGSFWKLDKGTGTNQIATEDEVKSKLSYTGSVTTGLCCTKSRALTMGANEDKLSSYLSVQLVKYSDIYEAKILTYKLYAASGESFYSFGCEFVDINGDEQTLTSGSGSSLKVTVGDDVTRIVVPLIANAWYKSSQYDTQNVGTISWSKSSNDKLIEGFVSGDGGALM